MIYIGFCAMGSQAQIPGFAKSFHTADLKAERSERAL